MQRNSTYEIFTLILFIVKIFCSISSLAFDTVIRLPVIDLSLRYHVSRNVS